MILGMFQIDRDEITANGILHARKHDESPSLRSLFVSVFTQLCKLTNCESHKLRLYAAAALGTFNLSEAVSDGNQHMIQFEKSAQYAERCVKELEAILVAYQGLDR